MAKENRIYRVSYVHKDKVYELFVESVYNADLWGFVVLEGFIFGSQTELVIDPSEDKLRQQFAGVARSFVPMQAIIQIDEVDKRGVAKISDADGTVTAFPMLHKR